jgi:hypothetical protein
VSQSRGELRPEAARSFVEKALAEDRYVRHPDIRVFLHDVDGSAGSGSGAET